MPKDFVVVGPGQLGQLYGAGALRAGYRVTPLRRGEDPSTELSDLPTGTPVLVAVGEEDLHAAVAGVPGTLRDDLILLQNELMPDTWRREGLTQPSVLIPWVLKKPGLPVTEARSSAAFGRHAGTLAEIHAALSLSLEVLANERALEQALVSKYVFILTINALGLSRDVTLGEWLDDPGPERDAILEDALRLGVAKLGHDVDTAAVRAQCSEAMAGLAAFGSRGRTAGARVRRALEQAETFGLELPALARLASTAG